jgi:hypothetical protein
LSGRVRIRVVGLRLDPRPEGQNAGAAVNFDLASLI